MNGSLIHSVEIGPYVTRVTLNGAGVAYLNGLGLERVPAQIQDAREHIYIAGAFVKRDGEWQFEEANQVLRAALSAIQVTAT